MLRKTGHIFFKKGPLKICLVVKTAFQQPGDFFGLLIGDIRGFGQLLIVLICKLSIGS